MEVFNINHSVSGCRVSSKLAFFSRLIMLYRFLKWRPLRRNFTFGFGLADSLQKIRVYQQTKFRSYSSIYVWVITTSDLEKNKHPPYWNSTSSFDFDHITVLGMSRWIRLQNFVQIGPSSAEIRCYVDFQDGGRCGAILLPVSNRLMSLFLKVSFCHQTKFRSCNSIHGWNITISVLKKQTSAALEFCFRFRFRSHHRTRHVILHQVSMFHPNRTICSGDMLSRFWSWRLLRCNFISGFGLGDVAVFRMSVSISKPIYIVITQSAAEI